LRKTRVLISNEFSEFATGFATYMKYILPFLHKTGKYEIAEHGINLNPQHPGILDVPWQVYPNDPPLGDENAWRAYSQDPRNNLGLWSFDRVVLDFKPDIVVSIADPWWINHIVRSPLKPFYKFVFMHTCDGAPQKYEWLDDTSLCDVVLTYSLWAKNVLEQESKGKIEVAGVASPGVDLEVFKPLENKALERKNFGLREDAIIFGTVMRNQPRKLFPEIMRAFVKYLELCKESGRDDLYERSFLYFHTSQPDVGWALNEELKRHKLSHKVIFTYMCHKCGHVYPSFFDGEVSVCRSCRDHTGRTSNPSRGVSREILAKIMGMFDLYIQHSIAAGWEMPINDAKACGVFVLATEYSAMQEQCYNGGAKPIPVKQFVQEPLQQTNQLRAWADNDKLAELMFEHVTLSLEAQKIRSQEARACVEKYYNWARIAKIWETVFDQIPQSNNWDSPPNFKQPNLNIPQNLNNNQFIEFCIHEILQDPRLLNSEYAQNFVAALNKGYESGIDGLGRSYQRPITREDIVRNILNEVNRYNTIEAARLNYNKSNNGVAHVSI
jgi:glycosyltransferase involved in cell wall biosynthesis